MVQCRLGSWTVQVPATLHEDRQERASDKALEKDSKKIGRRLYYKEHRSCSIMFFRNFQLSRSSLIAAHFKVFVIGPSILLLHVGRIYARQSAKQRAEHRTLAAGQDESRATGSQRSNQIRSVIYLLDKSVCLRAFGLRAFVCRFDPSDAGWLPKVSSLSPRSEDWADLLLQGRDLAFAAGTI